MDGQKLTCIRIRENELQLDGMHTCPETFQGRVNAGVVCLLDCKFNRRLAGRGLAECDDGCNSRYMNLEPIAFRINAELNEEVDLTP